MDFRTSFAEADTLVAPLSPTAISSKPLAATGADTVAANTLTLQNFPKNRLTLQDGTHLFVRDWGAGAPIVFLAGWCLTTDSWGYQMPDMVENGFRCIAYDRRGHGKSDDPGGGYDYDTLADDLAELLEQRNLDGVTLVAHSMASGEVIRYMTRHRGKRVAKIAMLGPTAPCLMQTANNPSGISREVFDQVRQELRYDFQGWIARNAAPFIAPSTCQTTIAWFTNQMGQTSMQAVLDCNRTIIESDFREELKLIDVPILVIHGSADASAPLELTGKCVVEIARNAKLKVYANAPHSLFATHARQVNADLLAFAS